MRPPHLLKRLTNNVTVQALGLLSSGWRTRPTLIATVLLLIGGSTVAELFIPIYSGRLIDSIVPQSSRTQHTIRSAEEAVLLIALCGAVSIFATCLARSKIINLNLESMTKITLSNFAIVQMLPADWHADNLAGATVRRITLGMWAVDWLHNTILTAIYPALLSLTGASIIVGLHQPSLGIVIGLGAFLYVISTGALSASILSGPARLSSAQNARLGGCLSDALACNAVVKAFGAEDRELLRLERILLRWRKRTSRLWKLGNLNGGTQLFVLLGVRTFVTAYAVLFWWRGQATPGDVTLVLTSYYIVHGYLRSISEHLSQLHKSVQDLKGLTDFEVVSRHLMTDRSSDIVKIHKGAVTFDHVTFAYSPQTSLFEELSVHIRPGERVGLVGPSGAGKTTFLKLLHRYYLPSGGTIFVDGHDIAEIDSKSLRRHLALVPQDPILFHRTLFENIAYSRPTASVQEVLDAARIANAHEFISKLPRGYQTFVGERGIKLSGGERQRIAIARAFLSNAPILLLDEATSNLDSESESLIQEAIERVSIGRTLIVVAHRLSTVRLMDRLLVFEGGTITEQGTHDDLLGNSGSTYRRMFQRQSLGSHCD